MTSRGRSTSKSPGSCAGQQHRESTGPAHAEKHISTSNSPPQQLSAAAGSDAEECSEPAASPELQGRSCQPCPHSPARSSAAGRGRGPAPGQLRASPCGPAPRPAAGSSRSTPPLPPPPARPPTLRALRAAGAPRARAKPPAEGTAGLRCAS